MKILYFILTLFILAGLANQVQAQHLNQQESHKLKKYFDKHLLKAFTAAKLKAESSVQRNSNFTTLSDSIHTFSKFAEGDSYEPGIKYYFTFDVVGGNAIVTAIDLKILDGSLPVNNLKAIPTYDSQGRISKITITTLIIIPQNVLLYYYNYDDAGNTTSIILESPDLLGGETTYVGDSVQFTYISGNRVSAYNTYTLFNENWIFDYGVSDLTYDGNDNITSATQWYPNTDTLQTDPVPAFTLRNIKWYNNSMPSSFINPLGGNSTEVETELTGIQIIVADEEYKTQPISFVQASYIDDVLVDSTQVRNFEQVSDRFTILDSYFETGDFIYTEITNYYYNSEDQLITEEILYDLGFGDPVPLDKTDYEHGEYGLTKSENFSFDQGQWISNYFSTFEFVVSDGELHEYTETNVFGADYESFKTVFFPSDALETSINETLLSDDVINVYPTVVKGNLTVSFPQHSVVRDVRVSVWSLDGKLMQNQQFDLAAPTFEVNVSKLSSGFYLLNVQMPEGIRTIRFVKE